MFIADLTKCRSDPCLNEGLCIQGVNNYTCHCLPRFTGKHCENGLLV